MSEYAFLGQSARLGREIVGRWRFKADEIPTAFSSYGAGNTGKCTGRVFTPVPSCVE
jgi:hypothetical protein